MFAAKPESICPDRNKMVLNLWRFKYTNHFPVKCKKLFIQLLLKFSFMGKVKSENKYELGLVPNILSIIAFEIVGVHFHFLFSL